MVWYSRGDLPTGSILYLSFFHGVFRPGPGNVPLVQRRVGASDYAGDQVRKILGDLERKTITGGESGGELHFHANDSETSYSPPNVGRLQGAWT